jgi:hypothetical protein
LNILFEMYREEKGYKIMRIKGLNPLWGSVHIRFITTGFTRGYLAYRQAGYCLIPLGKGNVRSTLTIIAPCEARGL